MNETSTAYLGLGSNLGEREEYLREAIRQLSENPQIEIAAVSSFYETAPVGYTDQPDFINVVVKVKTTLSPQKLLEICLSTEKKIGRVRTIRWGPRVIDIDILLYNDLKVDEKDLQIPHPRMLEREFVIRPLAEVAPDLILPNSKTARETLAEM
jgi:2-amino-4-hydroxy-6-hydroxymethyldihydropteridine diphosphokinase